MWPKRISAAVRAPTVDDGLEVVADVALERVVDAQVGEGAEDEEVDVLVRLVDVGVLEAGQPHEPLVLDHAQQLLQVLEAGAVVADVVQPRLGVVVEFGLLHGREEADQVQAEVVRVGHVHGLDSLRQNRAQEELATVLDLHFEVLSLAAEILPLEAQVEGRLRVELVDHHEDFRVGHAAVLGLGLRVVLDVDARVVRDEVAV